MAVRRTRVKLTFSMVNGDTHEIVMFPSQAEHIGKLMDRRWAWSRYITHKTQDTGLVLRRTHITSIKVTKYPSLVVK